MDRRSFLIGAITAAVVPTVVTGAASIRPEPKELFVTKTTLEELSLVHEPLYDENEEFVRLVERNPDWLDYLAHEYRSPGKAHVMAARCREPFLESTRDGWRRWVYEQGFDTITIDPIELYCAFRITFSKR